MIKFLSEQEILGLLEKSEEELRALFLKPPWFYILPNRCCLPDLAERLWEKTVEKTGAELVMAMVVIWPEHPERSLSEFDVYELWIWWAKYAKPIHRIVAALLALKRAGVEL